MEEQTKKPAPGSFAALMSPTPPVEPEEKEHKGEQVKKENKEKLTPKNTQEKTKTDKYQQPRPAPTSYKTEKEETQTKPKSRKTEKRERQLNAWISSSQNELLNKLYFQLRAKGIRVKKGELVGVAIEILSRILEKQDSRKIDSSVLDRFVERFNKT